MWVVYNNKLHLHCSKQDSNVQYPVMQTTGKMSGLGWTLMRTIPSALADVIRHYLLTHTHTHRHRHTHTHIHTHT